MLQVMKRIQVIGPKADLDRAVDLLYEAGTLHIENALDRIGKDEIQLTGVRQDEADEIAGVLGTINAIFSTLPAIADDSEAQNRFRSSFERKTPNKLVARARSIINSLETTTRDLAAKKTELALSISNLNRYEKVLDIIHPVEKELPALEGFEVTILLIQEEHKDVIELIKNEINSITGNRFEMIATTVDAETLAAIMVFPKKYSEEIHSFIYSVNVNEVRLPSEFARQAFL